MKTNRFKEEKRTLNWDCYESKSCKVTQLLLTTTATYLKSTHVELTMLPGFGVLDIMDIFSTAGFWIYLNIFTSKTSVYTESTINILHSPSAFYSQHIKVQMKG